MAETHVEPAATEVDPSFLESFSERFGAAWNSHQPERLVELMTEDIVYDDSAWTRTMRGHGDVREFLEFLWRAMPDLEFQDLEGPFLARGSPRLCSIGGARRPSLGRWTHRASRPPAHGSRSKGLSSSSSETTACAACGSCTT